MTAASAAGREGRMFCPRCGYQMRYMEKVDVPPRGLEAAGVEYDGSPFWLCTRWTCGTTVSAEPRP